MSDIQRVKVVRVACDGEPVRGSPIERFQNYNLPTTHDIFSQGIASELSKMIGIPLVVLQVYPSRLVEPRDRNAHRMGNQSQILYQKPKPPAYGYGKDDFYYPNEVAAMLMAHDAQNWSEKIGSVMVARQDGNDFYREHLQVILDFFQEVFKLAANETVTQQEQLAVMSPEVFKHFYEDRKPTDPKLELPPLFNSEMKEKLGAEDVEMVDEAIVMA